MAYAWLTPDAQGADKIRALVIPEGMVPHVIGALDQMTYAASWEGYGAVTPEQAAQLARDIIDSMTIIDPDANIGTIFPHIRSSIPDRALAFDGTTYLRVDYPKLYDRLHPAFIDNAEEFTLPDWSARMLLSEGSGYAAGQVGGDSQVSLSLANLPPINHTDHTHTLNLDVEFIDGIPEPAASASLPRTQNLGGNSTPFSIMPPYGTARQWCVWALGLLDDIPRPPDPLAWGDTFEAASDTLLHDRGLSSPPTTGDVWHVVKNQNSPVVRSGGYLEGFDYHAVVDTGYTAYQQITLQWRPDNPPGGTQGQRFYAFFRHNGQSNGTYIMFESGGYLVAKPAIYKYVNGARVEYIRLDLLYPDAVSSPEGEYTLTLDGALFTLKHPLVTFTHDIGDLSAYNAACSYAGLGGAGGRFWAMGGYAHD